MMNKGFPGSKSVTKNEEGFVLVIALLGLLVVTVLGVLALSTSTTEVMMAGNERLREINFSGAEGGLEIAQPVINYVAFAGHTACAASSICVGIVPNFLTFQQELRSGTPFDPADSCVTNPDITLTVGNTTVTADVDYMSSGPCAGSAIEFASGYEGIGSGGSGGVCAYYRVNSMARGGVGSESVVGAVYRYVAY